MNIKQESKNISYFGLCLSTLGAVANTSLEHLGNYIWDFNTMDIL